MAAFTFTSSGGAASGGSLTTTHSPFGFILSGGPAAGGTLVAVHSAYKFISSGGPAAGGGSTRTTQVTSNGATVIATSRAPAYSSR